MKIEAWFKQSLDAKLMASHYITVLTEKGLIIKTIKIINSGDLDQSLKFSFTWSIFFIVLVGIIFIKFV